MNESAVFTVFEILTSLAVQGHDEELGSSQDEDEEVVYQNHQVHHNVINHSNPNRTVESSPMRWVRASKVCLCVFF